MSDKPAATLVFSDVSRVDDVTTFAVVELSPRLGLLARSGRLRTPAGTTVAEIFALAFGVATCEPAGRVIAYTDVAGLARWFRDPPDTLSAAVARGVHRLRAAGQRHGALEVRTVNRQNPYYRQCHDRAKGLAKKIAGR